MTPQRATTIRLLLGRAGWSAAIQLAHLERMGMDPIHDGWGECWQARREWRWYGAGKGVDAREAMEAVGVIGTKAAPERPEAVVRRRAAEVKTVLLQVV